MTKPLFRLLFSTVLSMLFISSSTVIFGSELAVTFTDDEGNLLQDAVIEILNPRVSVPDNWDYSGLMDQVDKEFVENVITVVAGSKVLFPNSDNLHHHVYSFSDNKTFELPLYIGDSAEPISFDEAGVTIVGCNIHDWMLGYIYVGQSHLIAKTNGDGRAVLPNLEAGEYSFSVWHPRIRRRDLNESHTVNITDDTDTEYLVELKLGRDRRIRRAPSAGGDEY